jgi:hypothetical protein
MARFGPRQFRATMAEVRVIAAIMRDISHSPVTRLSVLDIRPYLRRHLPSSKALDISPVFRWSHCYLARLSFSALCLTTPPLVASVWRSGECDLEASSNTPERADT